MKSRKWDREEMDAEQLVLPMVCSLPTTSTKTCVRYWNGDSGILIVINIYIYIYSFSCLNNRNTTYCKWKTSIVFADRSVVAKLSQ